MAVYKEEKTGTWRVIYRYTDWTGEKRQTQKRGFQTKREAQAWEREQLNKARADLDMTFKSFVEQYTVDMQTRIKENTWATKEHIIRSKLLPYFGKLKMCNITAQQIITWQNELMNYKDENGKTDGTFFKGYVGTLGVRKPINRRKEICCPREKRTQIAESPGCRTQADRRIEKHGSRSHKEIGSDNQGTCRIQICSQQAQRRQRGAGK